MTTTSVEGSTTTTVVTSEATTAAPGNLFSYLRSYSALCTKLKQFCSKNKTEPEILKKNLKV